MALDHLAELIQLALLIQLGIRTREDWLNRFGELLCLKVIALAGSDFGLREGYARAPIWISTELDDGPSIDIPLKIGGVLQFAQTNTAIGQRKLRPFGES